MSDDRIGALRHRLILEQAVRGDDGGGGVTESWVEVATLWGAIHPLTGGERNKADRIAGDLTHEIIIRYRNDIIPAMRFRMGSRVFHILARFDPEEQRRRLKCFCEERDL